MTILYNKKLSKLVIFIFPFLVILVLTFIRQDDLRTLDEFRESARGISDSLDRELQKLDTLLYEAQGNRRFTKFSELVQDMIEIKRAEREEWEEILNIINFLLYQ